MLRNKVWIIEAIIVLSFMTLATHAMEEREIEFQGRKAPAAIFIEEAKLNPEIHPFSATQLFQYEDGSYQSTGIYLVGNICDISQKDLEKIRQGNFIYCKSYKSARTHFSGQRDAEIAAFILDTKNERYFTGLYNWQKTPLVPPRQSK